MTCGNGSAASPSPALPVTPPALRPNPNGDGVTYATKLAMQTLGRRVFDIDADCAHLHGELTRLVRATAPSLLELPGVGIHTAALLLVAAGDNAERITLRGRLRPPLRGRPDPRLVRQDRSATGSTGAATAKPTTPCGASCSPAWAPTRAPAPTSNAALAEGRSKPEIMRVLKRYVAREVYRHLPRAERSRSSGGSGPRNASTPPRLSCERSADPPLHPRPRHRPA